MMTKSVAFSRRVLLQRAAFQAVAATGFPGAESVAQAPPNGIHALTTASGTPGSLKMLHSVLELDYISGLLVYVMWKDFEPNEDQINWPLFEVPLDMARKKNKVAAFALTVQGMSPAWVKQRCRTFTFEHIHPSVGEVVSPIPWDPDYRAMLGRTISAVGRRFDGHPALHYVAINGPSSLFGVETNFPVKKIEPEEVAKLAYTHEKFEAGWKQSVDLFTRVFPKSRLSLGLHDQISLGLQDRDVRLRTVRSIRDYAIERQAQHKRRLIVRLLGLALDNPRYFQSPYCESGAMSAYVRLAWEVRESADMAFESARVNSRSNLAGRLRPLSAAEFERLLENGISLEPQWLEIKDPDVWDSSQNAPYALYARSLEQAHRRLQHRKGQNEKTL
jgi:hypothetical protein